MGLRGLRGFKGFKGLKFHVKKMLNYTYFIKKE